MAAVNFPNGILIAPNAVTFEDSILKAQWADLNGIYRWTDNPTRSTSTDALTWDLSGFITVNNLLTSTSIRLPLYTVATLPAVHVKGRLAFTTDTNQLFYDDGTNWVQVTGTVAPSFTAPVTINQASGTSGSANPFLNFAWASHPTWRFWTENAWAATAGGPFNDLALDNTGNTGLQMHWVDVTGGQRVWIWNPSNAALLKVHPSTGALPAFAVFGDLTVGDIWTFSPSGNAYIVGGRTTTGLVPSTDITHYMCSAKTAGVEPDGGATIDLYPTDNNAGATNDGIAEVMAYGRGSAGLANSVLLSNRSAASTVTRRWQMGGPGNVGDLNPFANNSYSLGSLSLAPHAVAAAAGTGSGTGFVPSVINLQAGVGTGSQANINENDLKTYTLPANSFVSAAGDCIRVIMTFRCAANATTKRIRVYFAGTAVLDSTAIANNNQTFMVIMLINNTGANTQFCFGYAMGNATGSAWNTNLTGEANFVGTTATMTNTQIIKATSQQGVGAAANDVIQDTMIVEYLRNAA